GERGGVAEAAGERGPGAVGGGGARKGAELDGGAARGGRRGRSRALRRGRRCGVLRGRGGRGLLRLGRGRVTRCGRLLGDTVQVQIAARLRALAGRDAGIALAREVHAARIFGALLIVAALGGDDVVALAGGVAVAEPVEAADDHADREQADQDRADQFADGGAVTVAVLLDRLQPGQPVFVRRAAGVIVVGAIVVAHRSFPFAPRRRGATYISVAAVTPM